MPKLSAELMAQLHEVLMNVVEKVDLSNLMRALQQHEELREAQVTLTNAIASFVTDNCKAFAAIRGSRSQHDVAERAGTKQPYVSALENGRVDAINNKTLFRLLEVYMEMSQEEDPVMAQRLHILTQLRRTDE